MPNSPKGVDVNLIHRREYELKKTKEKIPVILAKAPGRIHFLGGHCSPYCNIFLSAAIDRYIQVAVSPRKDNSLRYYAADFGERKRTTISNLKYRREDRWSNYFKTAVYVFIELGYPVKGLNFTISGNIPKQIGLASSSAIEVAAATALKGLFNLKIADIELASRLAQAHFIIFGKHPELADYITGICAKKDQFLLIDEADHSIKRFKSPFLRCKIILLDSGISRSSGNGELAVRRGELKSALKLLSKEGIGINFRELAEAKPAEVTGNLPEELRRRTLHVIQEIRRIPEAGNCLANADLQGFAKEIFHSHESLRDLYELSCPEIDWMVKRASETEGAFGARMTGNGFGCCTYVVVKNEALYEFNGKIDDYERIFGFHPSVYEVKLATGSHIVKKGGK